MRPRERIHCLDITKKEVKLKRFNNSIRTRLFLILTISVLAIVCLLMIINTFIYKPFYIYSKQHTLENVFRDINKYSSKNINEEIILAELEKIAIRNGIDIIIITNDGKSIYSSNRDFMKNITQLETSPYIDIDVIERKHTLTIQEISDKDTEIKFMVLNGLLDNGNFVVLRLPISAIDESVQISNTFLYITGTCVIIISAIMIIFVSKSFTRPILQLEEIAEKVSNLDFTKKYEVKDTEDEIDKV